MKCLMILAFICFIAYCQASLLDLNEEQKAKAKTYFEECIKQENVSEEEATKLRNKNFADPSQNLKCFGTCFFEKAGTLKHNKLQHEVVLEKLGSILGEEKTKTILEKCKDVQGEDRCDTGFKFYECFEKTKTELVAA